MLELQVVPPRLHLVSVCVNPVVDFSALGLEGVLEAMRSIGRDCPCGDQAPIVRFPALGELGVAVEKPPLQYLLDLDRSGGNTS